jgi:hypothetical protein
MKRLIMSLASNSAGKTTQDKRQRERAKELLIGKLLEGQDSGRPISFTAGYIKAKKRALIQAKKKRA